MSRHQVLLLGITVILVMSFLAGCGGPVTTPAATEAPPTTKPITGRIEGRILLDKTSEPIANVNVNLLLSKGSEGFEEVVQVKTDSKGQYSIGDVKPGTYILSAFVQGKCMTMDLPHPITIVTDEVVKRDLSLPCIP